MVNESCQTKKKQKKTEFEELLSEEITSVGVIIFTDESDIDITIDDSNDSDEVYGEERRNVDDKKRVVLAMTRAPMKMPTFQFSIAMNSQKTYSCRTNGSTLNLPSGSETFRLLQ